VVEKSMAEDLKSLQAEGRNSPDIAFLKDGPYGIPVPE